MGPFPLAVLIACLTVMRWLCFVAGGLMGLLALVQQVRGDEAAQPLALGLGAAILLVVGWLSGRVAAFFQAQA